MAPPINFLTIIGDRQADVTFDGADVLLDGTPVTADFRSVGQGLHLILDGRSYEIFLETTDRKTFSLLVGEHRRTVTVRSKRDVLLESYGLTNSSHAGEREIRAPMPGLVLELFVVEGQPVEAGARLLVLEAMKMENEVRAATAGSIARVHVRAGDAVGKNELLVEMDT